MDTKSDNEFERVASEIPRKGLAGDFWAFLRQNKKWWLLPILIMLLLFGVLIFVSSTALAPFIYTLF
jgi:drug/metabolite transporter superfamily protein YnfA